MTEQEVIKYLKKNRVEGVIISFMPKEVQNFCHLHKQNLLVWQSGHWYKFDADDIADDDVVTLSDSFQVLKEQKSGWEEFEIDNDGTFFVNGLIVLWFNWQHVLSDSYGKKNGFTAFGGWQYGDDPRWYLAPAAEMSDGTFWNSYVIIDTGEVKPAIPTKIRFWKEAK